MSFLIYQINVTAKTEKLQLCFLFVDGFIFYFISDTLRALYLGDNDFEVLPPEIGKLKNLQIVSETCI